MNSGPLTVVALGGNAISREGEEGNVDQQFANSRLTARSLADLVVAGHRLVITHGNGPQIGNFLLRNEAARDLIYPLPMEVAVAHVQGGMGFMIAQSFMNELSTRSIHRVVATIVTTVEVSKEDEAFRNPTKPIGRVMTRDDASRFASEEDWSVKEISPGKWRRVVPSPKPERICEIDLIRRCVNAGDILVACGGGGIPVTRDAKGSYRGTAAVIDKDFATALLAAELGADLLMILTAVDRVCVDFGKPTQRSLDRMSVAEANRYLADGQFPAGSMGPKVQGAIDFLRMSKRDGARAVIGPLHAASAVAAGKLGTTITR